MTDPRLKKLQSLSQMMLDAELAALRRATRKKEASEAVLAALATPQTAPDGLSPIAAGLAAVEYQRWADRQRAEINSRLARQTAAWMEARDAAARAFGKTRALEALAARQIVKKG